MQYYKDGPKGRTSVDEECFMADKLTKKVIVVLNTMGILVYKTSEPILGRDERLRYGGRNRGGSHLVWNGC